MKKHLRNQKPDGLLQAFSEASTDLKYVLNLSAKNFTQILQLLDPEYFVEPYKQALDDLSPADLKVLGIRPVQTFFAEFFGHVQDVIWKRTQAEHALTAVDYVMLLNCARSMGDVQLADAVWTDMRRMV